jgi:pimeloyl-ACP methyl ester carboxylesterase
MSEHEDFRTRDGAIAGWTTGEGTPVLLMHGGPGLSFEYLTELGVELGEGYRVAAFQQRGLAPSTTEGPFTMVQALADVLAVLDGLGWEQCVAVGHSWGGHLALRFAAAHPERLIAALAVDPLGVAGDGGEAAFEAEMGARTPRASRERAMALDQRAMAGQGTEEEALEALELVWPAYWADPGNAPPMPPMRQSVEAYSGLHSDLRVGLDDAAAALGEGRVPFGVVAGAASPLPWGQAALATVELSPRAFLALVPAAGHFPWIESPGSVRGALERLLSER